VHQSHKDFFLRQITCINYPTPLAYGSNEGLLDQMKWRSLMFQPVTNNILVAIA
jgi:hypothetical protein